MQLFRRQNPDRNSAPDALPSTDRQLLERFIEPRDQDAFESLIRIHGPLVLGVCRRVTGHHHDAEEAFQAAFLVLARKAATIWPRHMLANWLHEVAYRSALKLRTATSEAASRGETDRNATRTGGSSRARTGRRSPHCSIESCVACRIPTARP